MTTTPGSNSNTSTDETLILEEISNPPRFTTGVPLRDDDASTGSVEDVTPDDGISSPPQAHVSPSGSLVASDLQGESNFDMGGMNLKRLETRLIVRKTSLLFILTNLISRIFAVA